MEEVTQEKLEDITHEFGVRKKDVKGVFRKRIRVVVFIIIVVAIIFFISLGPLGRIKDARDSNRWTDIIALMTVIQVHQVDNGGFYLSSIIEMEPDTVYMISSATTYGGCNFNQCDREIASPDACVNLTGYVDRGYIANVPVSPQGKEKWSSIITGYYLEKTSRGNIVVGACESENSNGISIVK